MGSDSSVGLRHRSRVGVRRHRGGRAILRVLPYVVPRRDGAHPRDAGRLRRRHRPPATTPSALQPLHRNHPDPAYAEATESEQVLLRPLFVTSFALDDWLFDNALFGARVVLLSSASSKTSYGLAFLLAERKRREGGTFEVIALTSVKNRPFVERLGTYEHVVTYDDVASLPPRTPTVLMDLTGSAMATR